MKKRILVFASGNGSNFENIVNHSAEFGDVEIELLVDKFDCKAVLRAKKLDIKTHFVKFEETYEYLSKIALFDLYVLAGYMRVLPIEVLKIGTFINIHPSLLPKYKGKNAILQAFEAKEKFSGASVHLVSEKVDSGKILLQKKLDISDFLANKNDNNEEKLRKIESEIHKIEHEIYPLVIKNLLNPKTVLVVGSGAREHAIANEISQSPFLKKLYLYGANDGFTELGEPIEAQTYEELAQNAKEKGVDLLVVGPEQPLSDCIVDIFEKKGIKSIGANGYFARLETSKHFAKKFMVKHVLPTAKYITADKNSNAASILSNFKTAPVIKADGLCAGKGVFVPENFCEAETILEEYLNKYDKIVVEERLFGEELSVIALYDGKNLVPFAIARDYKRLLDDDKGPNTGGMGSYCPVEISDFHKKELKKYLKNLEKALNEETSKTKSFVGLVYSGLMLTEDGIKVLEYNMRFGDPETQAIMQNLRTDLLGLFLVASENKLENVEITQDNEPSICVVVASYGYPQNPLRGCKIENCEEIEKKYNVKIYYAGVKKSGKNLVSNGGRVLSICASGKNARKNIYLAVANLKFDDKIYRKDIALWKN